MLIIRDEQITHQLAQLAERENRPVEHVLKSMLSQYSEQGRAQPEKPGRSEAVKRVRRKAYAKAREYWQSVGDTEKATLSDEELDEQFGVFDSEGIPRLKSELETLDPPVGSLAYAAKVAQRGQFLSGKPDLAQRAKEILDEHFADDFSKGLSHQNDE